MPSYWPHGIKPLPGTVGLPSKLSLPGHGPDTSLNKQEAQIAAGSATVVTVFTNFTHFKPPQFRGSPGASRAASFIVSIQEGQRAPVIVTLPAEIDVCNQDGAYGQLYAAFVTGAHVVVADFSGTTFCDCSSLRRLLAVRDRAVARTASFGWSYRLAARCAVWLVSWA